ncbi:MAG: hypothetical protein WBV69_13670 [Candidatus Sulfotelmatobacter sp.]
MLQMCRPTGRLFYLVLAVMLAAWGGRSVAREVSAREPEMPASQPEGKAREADPAPHAASPAPQSAPTLTSVIDTVYQADGTPAQGVLIITWPAFVTVSGTAVAAGNASVTLGANGSLNAALAANAGATPAGIYYSVVYQLGPGEVRTEYWVVPASSPATLAQVRTTPGAGTASQPVSMQYVNTALAEKANDSAVVHLAGTETVTGTKIFSSAPSVPSPVGTGDVTNKAYVDSSIAAVGAGNYLPTAGGAMTGPLTLSGNPTAPLQAAAKQYVDSSTAVKADLISGLVPTGELGSGTASGLNCLLGSGAWGPCGSSANATAIQSVPVAATGPGNGQVLTYSSTSGQYAPATPIGAGSVTVTPSASQSIAQPLGTQFSVNNVSGIRYVTASDNWSANPSGSLTAGTQATVTLSSCPLGIDTSGYSMYYLYVSGQGAAEPVMVTGGTCVAGASGTIVFTPKNAHSAGYKIGSATSGIQEAINDACGLPNGTNAGNPNARIILPATGVNASALPVYGSIFAHCSRALIEGNGTLLSCSTRDRCMVLGDLVNSNHYGGVTLRGVNFTSTVTADGCRITNAQRISNVVTITTASACGTIQTGDIVNINFTDNPAYWGNHGPVTVSGTSISYSQTAANLAATATPGTIAIENAAVEDNAMPGTMEDIKSSAGGGGSFNQFFVMDDDEAATIRNFDADGTQGITCTANHCGSYVYSANSGAAVLWLSHLNISPQCSGNGVTVYNNNSVRISDSVIQGFGMWAVNTQAVLGNYGGTTMENVFMEEGAEPCVHPYEGNYFSASGIIFEGNVQPLLVRGGEQPAAHVSGFGAQNPGTVQYNYYVIANDTTQGWHSAPLFAGYALTNGTGSVTGQFPHVPPASAGDVVTYDILRMEPAVSLAANTPSFPMKGACTGGSATACGSIVTGQAQCAGLVCIFTDTSASANTTSYSINSLSWEPILPFWPATVVLAGNGTQTYATPTASFDTEPSDVVAVNWNTFPEVYVRSCLGSSITGGLFGGAWEECQDGSGTAITGVGTLLNDGLAVGGQPSGVKGKLNFESVFSGAHHIITLVDSNLAKTTSTINFRPPNDANDTYIGLDNASPGTASAAQLAFGSPVAISNYIGNKGDNTSYLERLTAAGKTFNVPVNVNGNLTVTGTCTGCGGGGSGTVNDGTAAQLAVYSASGAAVSGDGSLTDSGSTLTYTGANGITAVAGTFSGNVTVNGQLLVAGPWTVSSAPAGSAMAAAAAGTSSLGISNDGNIYISANAGTPQKVATTATSSFFSNLFQEDANDLGEYNGTTAQGLNVYGTRGDASDYERLQLMYDTVNTGFFKIDAQALGTGVHRGLAFWVNGAGRWGIDQLNMFKPFVDNAYDLGSTTFRVRNGYFGTGVVTPSITLSGNGLSNVIGTPSANLMTAGTVSGTGQPLCTDGTGNLTITTVGCPPGTGTIGGSGSTEQFAYWTNTNGLGAAPLYLTGANTVEQYNGTNVETFNVYGTFPSAGNYERASLAYVPGDTYYELQTQQAGTGLQRGICFGVNNSCKWAVDTTTAFKPFNDNTRDIGTSTLRVRDFYLARNLIMSGTVTTYNGKATAGIGLSPVYGAISSSGLTAAVASTTACASATCGAGQYVVDSYLDSAVSCTTPGSAAASVTIGWTDETSAKTLQVPLSGSGVSGGNSITLGNTTNFGNGAITLWSSGSANITYSTSYTGCITGTGTYAVRIAVRQLQ